MRQYGETKLLVLSEILVRGDPGSRSEPVNCSAYRDRRSQAEARPVAGQAAFSQAYAPLACRYDVLVTNPCRDVRTAAVRRRFRTARARQHSGGQLIGSAASPYRRSTALCPSAHPSAMTVSSHDEHKMAWRRQRCGACRRLKISDRARAAPAAPRLGLPAFFSGTSQDRLRSAPCLLPRRRQSPH